VVVFEVSLPIHSLMRSS